MGTAGGTQKIGPERQDGAVTDAQRSAEQYDAMAQTYAEANATSAYNAFYERPATISLLGDLRGRRVLDAGCGPGALSVAMADAGAQVTGVDVSNELLQIARDSLGDKATFLNADLSQTLSFADDNSFDLVGSSLVMHYIRDWVPVLTEFHRVLAPGGAVVFSTHHPAMDWQAHSPEDYFAIKQVTEDWRRGGTVTFWRRPLTAMTSAISAAGFVVDELLEAAPDPALRESDPRRFESLSTQPTFLHFRLRTR